MAFYKRPFLFITTLFIVGVILSNFSSSNVLFDIFLILFLAVAVVAHFLRRKKLFVWSSSTVFILLGLVISLARVPDKAIDNQLDNTFLIEVLEAEKTDKNWKKVIGRVPFLLQPDWKESIFVRKKQLISTGCYLLLHKGL